MHLFEEQNISRGVLHYITDMSNAFFFLNHAIMTVRLIMMSILRVNIVKFPSFTQQIHSFLSLIWLKVSVHIYTLIHTMNVYLLFLFLFISSLLIDLSVSNLGITRLLQMSESFSVRLNSVGVNLVFGVQIYMQAQI